MCGNLPAPAHRKQLLHCQEFGESVDKPWVVSNGPQWEYLHHENWRMLQIRVFKFLLDGGFHNTPYPL